MLFCTSLVELSLNTPFIRRSSDCGINNSLRVLIVEDEVTLSKQLAAEFTEAGYALDCAADGERGICQQV